MPKMKRELPAPVRASLSSLSGPALRRLVSELYAQGWSLSEIAEGSDPPRARSTVHSWIAPLTDTLSPPPSLSSSPSSDSTFAAAEETHFSPPRTPPPSSVRTSSPSPSSSPAPAPTPPRPRYRPTHRQFDPRSPTIPPHVLQRIKELAPLARRHRARANPYGEYALANLELTEICRALLDSGTTIRELAAAAGVTYKAMQRRVQ